MKLNIALKIGDRVQLSSFEILLSLFNKQSWFLPGNREKIAKTLDSKTGKIVEIQERYVYIAVDRLPGRYLLNRQHIECVITEKEEIREKQILKPAMNVTTTPSNDLHWSKKPFPRLIVNKTSGFIYLVLTMIDAQRAKGLNISRLSTTYSPQDLESISVTEAVEYTGSVKLENEK